MALWGTVPTVYRFTRAEMPKSKVNWMALCTDLRKQCGASTKHVPLPYWQQWTETGGQTCWMTGWRCLHSFICWPHCRAHELLVFFFFVFPLDNWGETIHFLNSFTLILIHLAIWCCIISWHGGSIISIFFGWGCSLWSIVFFTELTPYQRKMMKFGCFWQKAHSLKINIKYD